jgi:hypothetical protein
VKNSLAAAEGGTLPPMQRAVRTITTVEQEVSLKAPQLLPLVNLLLLAHERPEDKTAYIQLRILAQQGADRCPSCSERLGLEGYRRTRTGFSEREAISCSCCRTSFVVRERQSA